MNLEALESLRIFLANVHCVRAHPNWKVWGVLKVDANCAHTHSSSLLMRAVLYR